MMRYPLNLLLMIADPLKQWIVAHDGCPSGFAGNDHQSQGQTASARVGAARSRERRRSAVQETEAIVGIVAARPFEHVALCPDDAVHSEIEISAADNTTNGGLDRLWAISCAVHEGLHQQRARPGTVAAERALD